MSIKDKIQGFVESVTSGFQAFDPSQFDDPVAEETSWGPAAGGGTNVGTHALRRISSERVEFKVRPLALIFPGVFMAAGLGIGAGGLPSALKKGEIGAIIAVVLFGLVFFAVGFFLARAWMTPRVFDKRRGFYWKGRTEPIRGMREDSKKRKSCPLDEIYAIQLISEHCSGNKGSSYYSYELNLVLQDGSRINVVDHGKRHLIIRDAHELAEFLDIPLWNAI